MKNRKKLWLDAQRQQIRDLWAQIDDLEAEIEIEENLRRFGLKMEWFAKSERRFMCEATVEDGRLIGISWKHKNIYVHDQWELADYKATFDDLEELESLLDDVDSQEYLHWRWIGESLEENHDYSN